MEMLVAIFMDLIVNSGTGQRVVEGRILLDFYLEKELCVIYIM